MHRIPVTWTIGTIWIWELSMAYRKLLGVLGVAFAAVLVAAGCGGDDDSTSVTPMEHADEMNEHMRGGEEPNAPVAEGARTVTVRASSFVFDPAEIEIGAGEDVAIELTSTDIEHDFVVEEMEEHIVHADGGATERGGLRVDEPGEYTFYCSIPGHRASGMEGRLIVTD